MWALPAEGGEQGGNRLAHPGLLGSVEVLPPLGLAVDHECLAIAADFEILWLRSSDDELLPVGGCDLVR